MPVKQKRKYKYKNKNVNNIQIKINQKVFQYQTKIKDSLINL